MDTIEVCSPYTHLFHVQLDKNNAKKALIGMAINLIDQCRTTTIAVRHGVCELQPAHSTYASLVKDMDGVYSACVQQLLATQAKILHEFIKDIDRNNHYNSLYLWKDKELRLIGSSLKEYTFFIKTCWDRLGESHPSSIKEIEDDVKAFFTTCGIGEEE